MSIENSLHRQINISAMIDAVPDAQIREGMRQEYSQVRDEIVLIDTRGGRDTPSEPVNRLLAVLDNAIRAKLCSMGVNDIFESRKTD